MAAEHFTIVDLPEVDYFGQEVSTVATEVGTTTDSDITGSYTLVGGSGPTASDEPMPPPAPTTGYTTGGVRDRASATRNVHWATTADVAATTTAGGSTVSELPADRYMNVANDEEPTIGTGSKAYDLSSDELRRPKHPEVVLREQKPVTSKDYESFMKSCSLLATGHATTAPSTLAGLLRKFQLKFTSNYNREQDYSHLETRTLFYIMDEAAYQKFLRYGVLSATTMVGDKGYGNCYINFSVSATAALEILLYLVDDGYVSDRTTLAEKTTPRVESTVNKSGLQAAGMPIPTAVTSGTSTWYVLGWTPTTECHNDYFAGNEFGRGYRSNSYFSYVQCEIQECPLRTTSQPTWTCSTYARIYRTSV